MRLFATALLACALAGPLLETGAKAANAGGYPAGVVKAGLQAVFDRRPGPVRPLTASGPPGLTKSAVGIGPDTMAFRGPVALRDVDTAGQDLFFNGGDFSLDNFRLSTKGGSYYVFAVGHVNGGPRPARLTLSNGVVDQANARSDRGASVVSPGSSLTATNVSFLHASGTNLNLLGDSVLTNVYFDSPGQNVSPDSHTEGPHVFGGTHLWKGVFFDARGWAGHEIKGTGQMFIEAMQSNADVTIQDSIFMGAAGVGLWAPIQFYNKPGYRGVLRLNNVVIQRGKSQGAAGYIVAAGDVKIIASGVVDADTGKNIDDQLNRLTK